MNEQVAYHKYGHPQPRHFWGPYRARQPWEPHPFDIFQHHSNNLRRLIEGIFPPVFIEPLRRPSGPGWYPPFRPSTPVIRPPGEFPFVIPEGPGHIEPSLEIIIESLPHPGQNPYPHAVGNIPIGSPGLFPFPNTEIRPIEPFPVPEPPPIYPSPGLSVIPLPIRPVQPIVPPYPPAAAPVPDIMANVPPMAAEVPVGDAAPSSTEETSTVTLASSTESLVTQSTAGTSDSTAVGTTEAPATKLAEVDIPVPVSETNASNDSEKPIKATVPELRPADDKALDENAAPAEEAASEPEAREPAENVMNDTLELNEPQSNPDEVLQGEPGSVMETEAPSESKEREEAATTRTEADEMETNQVRR